MYTTHISLFSFGQHWRL